MGAGAGAAAAIENEPSPRRAAIEKAQAELRREVAVREERRRELEFLEKGGELLDFFSAASSVFPQPSSTDPLADQLLSSEVAAGFTSIAVANGDSLENSVGTSLFVGRVSEGGDYLVGDDVASGGSMSLALPWEGNGRVLRTGSSSLRSQVDVNLKRESEGSGGCQTGGKGQAYSRRNRARSNRFGNGYVPTREVEKAVDSSSISSFGFRAPPAPLVVPGDASEGKESMLEKNVKSLLVHLALPNIAGNWVGLGSAEVNEHLEGSIISLVTLPDQHSAKHVLSRDASVDLGKLHLSCEAAVSGCIALSHDIDVTEGLCSGSTVKQDLPVGKGFNKLEHLMLTPRLEEKLDAREESAVLQPLEQVLCNSQAYLDKLGARSKVAQDENSVVAVRESSSAACLLGPHAARSECKIKSFILGTDSQTPRGVDRCTTLPSNHVPDSTRLSNPDNNRFTRLEETEKLQVTSMSLDSSQNRSDTSRKTTATVSTGVLDLPKIDKAMMNKKLLECGKVDVNLEEGFSEMRTRLCSVDTEVESGHDERSACVVSFPQEEVKTDGQSTPVSAIFNRASLRTPGSLTISSKFPGVVLPWEKEKDPNVIAEAERHKADLSAKAKKAHEDYVIEEAEIVKAGKKETAEWGKRKPEPAPVRRKSHWDFVLEEMAWMANDFMQERLWKMASATQFCRWIAQHKGWSEFQAKDVRQRQKKIARVLANAVNEFWRSPELSMYKDKDQFFSAVNSQGQEFAANAKDEGEAVPMDVDIPAVSEVSVKQLVKQQPHLSKRSLPVQGYAKRFIRELLGGEMTAQAEAPSTPERTSEASSVLDPLWEEHFSEEPLFYTVPNGALAAYRYLVETQRALIETEHEKTLQEHAAALAEAEADAVAEAVATSDFLVSSMDEGQSLACLSSPSKGMRADEENAQYGLPHSSIAKKKRKNILKSTAPEVENLPSSGLSHPLAFLGFDSGGGLPSPLVTGKRSLPAGSTPTSANVGSIPTKRMRSGTNRQRPLGIGSPSSFSSPAGLMNRTMFVSGGFNSNREEVHNVADCAISTRTEGDAAGGTGKNILGVGSNNPFVNSKSKKKKKTKHFIGALGSSFKADGAASGNSGSTVKPVESEHHSKYDQLKRKGDLLHFGSNDTALGGMGSSAETPEAPASQGQQPLKKAKFSKQVSDMNLDTSAVIIDVPATQAGSMVTNTSSTSKLLRQNSNRDRNRKSRSNKISVSQPAGIGIPWSTIEDQAILALVHDLGPNWELVSDVLSSSSQLKGVFRRPKQCKDRHKALMDRLAVGEGSESPDGPNTSQPHPSTLPGIPKGSARVLLQRLQGPMEEDTLKIHLEHIVRVVQKFLALKPQSEEQKLLVSPHPSHMNAVSQFCNSGLTGGFPTPLELCDLSAANPELGGGPSYQMPGPHLAGVLPAGSGMRPTANALPAMAVANNLHIGAPAMAASNATVNAARDVHRLTAMRPFSPEEAHRVRYARAMAAARGLQVPGAPVSAGLSMMALPSPNDCSVPLLSGGTTAGMSRGISLGRAALSGISSPGVSCMGSPALGNMLPPGGIGMVGAGSSVGSAGITNQVNLMRRPRDQMARPARINEEQRQIFIQELQHQAAQGNTEAQTALTTLNRDLSSPLITAVNQNFSSQQHQSQQQQQYIVTARMAKERQQLQHQQHKQRLLQQQLQQPTSLPLPPQQQQQQLHPLPTQQHVVSQQSHMSQHQHLLPQQHSLQKQQSQQGPQQAGLPLPLSPMQPMAPTSMPTGHQQQHQTLPQPQLQSQQQLQASGQVQQLSVQSKLQQSKQSQKHHHLQQSSQSLQHQQPRGSKGVVRGPILMQALTSQPGQPNMPPGNVALGNQMSQQMTTPPIPHSVTGQRTVQPQGPMSMGKQLSPGIPQGGIGQGGHIQAPQSQTVAVSPVQVSVGQQQKVPQPPQVPLPAKQQAASPPLHPLLAQHPPSTPGLSNQQQQLSPPAHQSPVAPSQQSQHPRRQSQQQTQLQPSGQRRLQQRQQGSNMAVLGTGQLLKSGSSQHGQISSQVPPSPGHVTFPLGTNMAVPVSMVGTSPGTTVLTSLGSSSTSGAYSAQWKPGQNVSPMPTGIYNLTRSGNSGTAQVTSVVNSSVMHVASPNCSSGMPMSSSNLHGVPVLHQTMQVGSGVHGQSINMISGTNSRSVSSAPQQGGAHRPSQQHHGNCTMSLTMGAGQVKPPVSASCGGKMPCSTLGTGSVAGCVPLSGSMAFQGSSAGHSTAMANTIPPFGVQPGQSKPATPARAVSELPQKSGTPTTANLASTGVSVSSPASVISPSTATNSRSADPTASSLSDSP